MFSSFTTWCKMVSIHAPRVGGDGLLCSLPIGRHSFNPRPPRGGRPILSVNHLPIFQVSIHAPRVGGDGSPIVISVPGCCFNPRSPRGGRHGDADRNPVSILFQSTPPAWGATSMMFAPEVADSVSIHAPRVGGDAVRCCVGSCC